MKRFLPWILLFVVAWLPRATVASQFEKHHPQADRLTIDELSYDSWGRELAASGDWLGDEVFFQEPLYPYVLGLGYSLGFERADLRQIQALLGALACLLIALTARRVAGPGAGWIAGGLFALERAAVAFPAYMLKPNLVLPLFALIAFLLLLQGTKQRAGRRGVPVSLALGFCCGLGALLRGNMLILLPLFVFASHLRWLTLRRQVDEGCSLRHCTVYSAAVLVGVLLALAPVALRNRAVGGELVLTTSGAGTNLYGGNNEDNLYGTPKEFDWVRGIPEFEAADWRREAERRAETELSPKQVSDYWLNETRASLVERPGLHARILWNKFRGTIGAFEIPDNR
ncbi:MAG: glycosyltransferase family 39 protein, partial [Planctomycetota bacterium]